MPYHGGPYITLGTIDSYGSAIGPLNIPYQRVPDSLDDIVKQMLATFVPWEWWIEFNGDFTCKQRRGTDKSATMKIIVNKHLGRILKEVSSKQTAQRVRVVGRGESAEQDLATSDWYNDTSEMENVGTFYEKLETEKSLSSKEESDILAQVLLTQNAAIRQEITVVLVNDTFTGSDIEMGDTVTVEDTDYGTSAAYRIKTIERTITENGEETRLTLTAAKTDISNRLTTLQKQLERLMNSSTFLDKMYGEGANQTKISTDDIEDVWSQTSSNKWAIDLPDDEADDLTMDSCNYAGGTAISWGCDKDVFEIYGAATSAAGCVFKYDPLLNFSRYPRFTCEFEIDTTGTDRDEWAEHDIGFIRIWSIDPANLCDLTAQLYGFGFEIYKSATQLELYAELNTDQGNKHVKIANIAYDTKYIIEARMEWKSRIVEYYFGKSDVEENDEWGFRLRAVLPVKAMVDTGNLCPFHAVIDAASGTTKTAIVIYRWKTQAMRLITTS